MRSSSRSALAALNKRSGATASASAAAFPGAEELSHGWVRVPSRSKPGLFYYAHPATRRTQAEMPEECRKALKARSAGPAAAGPAPKPALAKAEVVDADSPSPAPKPEVATPPPKSAEELRAEAEARKKKAEELARKQAEEAEAEEAAREELLRKAREKRAKERAAAAKEEEDDAEAEQDEEVPDQQEGGDGSKAATKSRKAAPGLAEAKGKRKKNWQEEDSEDNSSDIVTQDDVLRWKENEERREREEAEAEIRRKEQEEQKREEDERQRLEEAMEAARQEAERERAMEEERIKKKEEEERQRKAEAVEKAKQAIEAQAGAAAAASAPATSGASPPRADGSEPDAKRVCLSQPDAPPPLSANGCGLAGHVPPTSKATTPALPTSKALPTQLRPPPMQAYPAVAAPRPPAPRGLTQTPPMNPLGTLSAMIGGSVQGPCRPPQESQRQTGTILWYNGRRRLGMLRADMDGQVKPIPSHGAPNGGLSPPVPGGLMHGTRVTYMLTPNTVTGQGVMCLDVRPVDGQVGLSCGGDSQIGPRKENEDRTMAVDLPEGLGHAVGIFDGHRGTCCADFLLQNLPKALVASVRDAIQQRLATAGSMEAITATEEAELVSSGMRSAFEVVDREYLAAAPHYGWSDGASAMVAAVLHGFALTDLQRSSGASTVPSAPGGQAKLFIAWTGMGRALLLRGTGFITCTQEHTCMRDDERQRLQSMGAMLVQDPQGIWWMGRSDRPDLARARQMGYTEATGPKTFLAASRGFGDILLKQTSPPVLTATPDVTVMDLTADDWGVVVAGRGVFAVMSEKEVSDMCLDMAVRLGQGPVEMAQALTRCALQKGATDNATCIVMRLGWANLPTASAPAPAAAASVLPPPPAASVLPPPPAGSVLQPPPAAPVLLPPPPVPAAGGHYVQPPPRIPLPPPPGSQAPVAWPQAACPQGMYVPPPNYGQYHG